MISVTKKVKRECLKRYIHTYSKFNYISKGGDMFDFKAFQEYIMWICIIQPTQMGGCLKHTIHTHSKFIYKFKRRGYATFNVSRVRDN